MAEPSSLPPFIESVLALRPPLATSTRTNLAPSFQLLQSIVNAIFGVSGLRGLEPGLWRAQLIRATIRAAQLIQAVWSKLGGKGGVILDDQGEDGRGVMRLQGVFSDIQMFVGSLTTLQDPLTTLLLDPAAFSRTQATINTLNKKLHSLANHYEVSDLLPTPLDKWKDEDVEDKSEDLGALPILIAKSRPSKAILQKFEADCVRREQAQLSNPDQQHDDNNIPAPIVLNEATSSPSTPVTALPPSSSSFASSGLSSAKRSEFLRFVYSQNPNLIANNESLDTAVAAGTAALSSMVISKPNIPSMGKGPVGPKSQKSLVQQRISSFATSGDAPPPLPSPAPISLPARRAVSDNPHASNTRKNWTVDMSALNGLQRQSSISITKPSPISGPSPQISVAAPPVNWRSSISRPTSIKSRSSISGDPPESISKPNSSTSNGHVAVADPSADPASTPKPPLQPTFAEQAAAIVAARKQRTISQSSSSTLPKDRVFTKGPVDAALSTGLPTTHEDVTSPETVKPAITPISFTSNPATKLPSSLNSTISSDSGFSSVISTDRPTLTNITTVTNLSPISSELSHPASPSSKPPLVAVPVASVRSPSSPAPGMSRVNSISSAAASPKPKASTLSSRSIQSLTTSPPPQISRRPSLAPPEPDPDFELVSDLIEHRSMLDVILAPELEPEAESMALSCSIIADSSESESAAVSPSADPNSSPIPRISDHSANTTTAPPTEELSLADLMEQASMFESWTPDQNETSLQLSPKVTTSPRVATSPTIVTSPTREEAPDPQSAELHSPARSPSSLISPPPSSGLLLETEDRSYSSQATSPISHRPSQLAIHPSPSKAFSNLPEAIRSEAVLTIAGSPQSTPSISGKSWATSLLSTPPAPSDFDWNLLNGNYYQTPLSSCLPPPENPLKSGWRILSLDGGGIRGLSMLYVIRELMTSIQTALRLHKTPLPCEIFEMICGIGTGGIIALLLGRMRLDISVAIEAYLQIVRQVFRQSKGVIAAVRKKTRFSATKLEAVTREVVQRISGRDEIHLADQEGARPICRTFVIAMRPSEGKERRGTMSKLKSYEERQPPPATGMRGSSCSIPQAARATSAAPLFFKPARAEELDLEAEPVVTSEMSLNNPALEAVKEAQTLCPGRGIDCLISLGAGKGVQDGSGSIARACIEMAESSARIAREVDTRARQQGWMTRYARFSVTGLKNEDNRGEWENPDWVKAVTVKYLLIDHRNEYDHQLNGLMKSWKSAYEETAFQQMLLDHAKTTNTPRSAFFPARVGPRLAARGEDLRRSISADHAQMQAAHKAGTTLLDSSSLRILRASQNSFSVRHSSSPINNNNNNNNNNSSLSPISPFHTGLYESLSAASSPLKSSTSSSNHHHHHHQPDPLDLKLPEFNFSKT
ncbi:hypothetical protein PCANC_06679 [Puccinia coronata f. sp. avenae]|uniref:PNPLA domain-containing protein n=1 Tax=Puccinia coronata f. sp. avenae TaxID=200324 RepID=A0A2N5VUE0_9BASI|nr:hypothetical protein PCANC_06679 [Puccinia coronata f. sp. avenae]